MRASPALPGDKKWNIPNIDGPSCPILTSYLEGENFKNIDPCSAEGLRVKSRFLESLAFDVEADGKLDGGYGTPALIENFLSGPAQASD